jgi:2-phosphosulfolactate phosphatase
VSVVPAGQEGFAYRFDWGPNGLRSLAPHAAVVVVVDVLSFTTAVDVALGRGATVLPYKWQDGAEARFATEHGAHLAVARAEMSPQQPWSLSPVSLQSLPFGSSLVLPSPNGSALAFAAAEAGARYVLAACLRNAPAVAEAARRLARDDSIAVIAAGERWHGETGPMRPAVEDLLGAGAVLAALDPSGATSAPRCSPEAAAARAAFVAARPLLADALAASASGRQLAELGFAGDVLVAAQHGISTVVPTLRDGRFVPA